SDVKNNIVLINVESTTSPSSAINVVMNNQNTKQSFSQIIPFKVLIKNKNLINDPKDESKIIRKLDLEIQFDLTNVDKSLINCLFMNSSINNSIYKQIHDKFRTSLANYFMTNFSSVFNSEIQTLLFNTINDLEIDNFDDVAVENPSTSVKPSFSVSIKSAPTSKGDIGIELTNLDVSIILTIVVSTFILIVGMFQAIFLILKKRRKANETQLNFIRHNSPNLKFLEKNKEIIKGPTIKSANNSNFIIKWNVTTIHNNNNNSDMNSNKKKQLESKKIQ
uniref:hypothetical protein n=1 Tax=Mycoplasmoides alvi TaxID=78580 RepID=UPI00051AE5B4